jgi:leucyl aminopeptidase
MGIALGNVRAGVFSNNQALADQVIAAGEAAGERMWQMPLDEDYKEQNKSTVADLKNTGGRAAGSITAAHFVGEFAGDTPWVHLDIAGVYMVDKDQGVWVKGASGIPVRSLVKLAQNLAQGT